MNNLNKDGLTKEEFLKNYDIKKYDLPGFTTDSVIFTVIDKEVKNHRKLADKKLNILLVKRNNHPELGKWALPGGFLNRFESVEDGAKRELKEETSVESFYLEQLETFGDPNRDERGWIISNANLALINSNDLSLKADTDADDVKWFEVKVEILEENIDKDKVEKKILLNFYNEELNISLNSNLKLIKSKNFNEGRKIEILNSDLAFDHSKIILTGVIRLRNKVEYTNVVFNLLDEKFTLTELQMVYETILDKKLTKPVFRKKIENKVEETDDYFKGKGNRPAKYFKFNSSYFKDSDNL